jgi:hypothetical protein
MTGEWPKEIDHKNTIRHDNRWTNLRLSNSVTNHQNQTVRSDNVTGLKGVTKQGNKYCARIVFNKKRINLGTRKIAEEAFELYKEAADKYYGEFARY